MNSNRRLLAGAIAAPPAGVLAVGLVVLGLGPVWDVDLRSGLHGTFFLLVFGIPIAYGVAALVGIPAFFALRSMGRLTAGSVVTIATIAGAASAPLVWGWFWGMGFDWVMALLGVIPGSVAGAVFWTLGARTIDPKRRPDIA